jgi:glycosyltransferase involved in cell wall biosynthesis
MAGDPIRIGVPMRALTPGGVTRFIVQLVRELTQHKQLCEVYSFYDDEDVTRLLGDCHAIHVPGRNRVVWDYFSFPLAARRYRLDYIIYPNNIIPLSHLLLLKTRRLNVIHDLAYFSKSLNEYRPIEAIYHRALMRLSCRIADQTVADSESTQMDLRQILHVRSEKLRVIHLGVEPLFTEHVPAEVGHQVLDRLEVKRPYLFYCGSLSPRKNVITAMRALKVLEDRIPHCLYLSGGVSWNDEDVRSYWARELPDRVIHLGHLAERELRIVYAHADAFLYPSLWEGFGLPILEAQASGCPVLTSRLKSCPEVAGSGAHYVNADSVESVRDGILQIVEDRAYRQRLIDAGHRNVERFSWQRCADGYLETMRADK